jgi:hypothetical protein
MRRYKSSNRRSDLEYFRGNITLREPYPLRAKIVDYDGKGCQSYQTIYFFNYLIGVKHKFYGGSL